MQEKFSNNQHAVTALAPPRSVNRTPGHIGALDAVHRGVVVILRADDASIQKGRPAMRIAIDSARRIRGIQDYGDCCSLPSGGVHPSAPGTSPAGGGHPGIW